MDFDQRYRLTLNKLEKLSPLSTIAQSTHTLDGVGNITAIADFDSAYSRPTLLYDDLNRLTRASASSPLLWGAGSYNYDQLGSMTSLTIGTRMVSFYYSGTTPKLMSVDESGIGARMVTYDAAGNETAVGSTAFTYSARNFLSSADGLTYTYDGRGLRVSTALSSAVFPVSLTINPASVVGGNPATGTLALNAGAPSGATLELKSSDAAVTFPINPVPVSVGSTSQAFTINSSSIAVDTKVVISAALIISGSSVKLTKSEVLTVTTTPRLVLVSVSPRTVQSGGAVTGTVTLNAAAAGNTQVTLTSSNPVVASVPSSVQVSTGLASAMFTVTTCPQPNPPCPLTASYAVTITASYSGVSRSASLTVVPFAVQGIPPEGFFASRVGRSAQIGLHLASLKLGPGTGRLFAGATWTEDVGVLAEEGFSLGMATGFGEGDGGVRPMDGPIYAVPGPPKRNFIYSPEMSLLAESEVSSPRDRHILYEYIWFNGRPIAQIDGATVTHWTFTDHLGTPILQTNSAGNVFWRAELEPYGRVWTLRPSSLADQHQPLRLPGQEAEQFNLGTNGLTERFYNVFRWYRPNWGRYTQNDPRKSSDYMSFAAFGAPVLPEHPYGYAIDNPLGRIDPTGRASLEQGLCVLGWTVGGAAAGGIAGALGGCAAGALLTSPTGPGALVGCLTFAVPGFVLGTGLGGVGGGIVGTIHCNECPPKKDQHCEERFERSVQWIFYNVPDDRVAHEQYRLARQKLKECREGRFVVFPGEGPTPVPNN